MARYTTSIRSPLPADDAFAYMVDVRNFARWDPGVVAVEAVSGETAAVGATYDVTVKAGGTSVMRYEVTECEPPRRAKLVAMTPTMRSVDEIRVEPSEGGSTITYDAELTLRGRLGLFDPFLRLAFRVIGDRARDGMRDALQGAVVAS